MKILVVGAGGIGGYFGGRLLAAGRDITFSYNDDRKLQSNPTSQVYVVDDDVHMREAVLGMLRSLTISASCFETASGFSRECPAQPRMHRA